MRRDAANGELDSSPHPLRDVFTAPPGSDGSSTSTAALRRASSSIAARDVSLPISSSVVHEHRRCGARGGAAVSSSARAASMPMRDARLHVEHAGAVKPAVLRVSGIALELADRPDRIEVTEQEDLSCAAAAEFRQQVIAAHRGPRVSRVTRARRWPSSRDAELGAAPVHGRLVRRRRFEADERLDRLEQPVALARRQKSRRFIIGSMRRSPHGLRAACTMLTLGLAARPGSVSTLRRPLCRRRLPRPQQPPPQPFPRPGNRAARAAARRRPTTAPHPPRPGSAQEAAPTEATLGVPIYPGAQFIASFDAGRGQRYYIFGTDRAVSSKIVSYYRTALKQKGELVYDVPATHMFEVGTIPRRDDGVSAGRDGQGLHVGTSRRAIPTRSRAAARAFPDGHPDRARCVP